MHANTEILPRHLTTKIMVKAQCLWNVAIKMNSSIDSTNVLVANLIGATVLGTMATLIAGFTPLNHHKK